MSSLNIITVIAIILFARLGVRLVVNYKKFMKDSDQDVDKKNKNSSSTDDINITDDA